MRKPTVIFGKLPPNVMGTCNYRTGIITIDLMKDNRNPAYVLIHELQHYYNPWMEEDEVTARAWLKWNEMGQEERLALLRKLFRRVK